MLAFTLFERSQACTHTGLLKIVWLCTCTHGTHLRTFVRVCKQDSRGALWGGGGPGLLHRGGNLPAALRHGDVVDAAVERPDLRLAVQGGRDGEDPGRPAPEAGGLGAGHTEEKAMLCMSESNRARKLYVPGLSQYDSLLKSVVFRIKNLLLLKKCAWISIS